MSAQRERGDDEVQSFAGAPVRVHVDARRVQGARKVWEWSAIPALLVCRRDGPASGARP